jgi:hypothetical protein
VVGQKGKYEIIGVNVQIIEKLDYKYPIYSLMVGGLLPKIKGEGLFDFFFIFLAKPIKKRFN